MFQSGFSRYFRERFRISRRGATATQIRVRKGSRGRQHPDRDRGQRSGSLPRNGDPKHSQTVIQNSLFIGYRETFELLSWLRVIYFRKPPWPYNFQVSKFDPYCIKHPQIVEVLWSKAHCIPLPLYNMDQYGLSQYIPIKLSV